MTREQIIRTLKPLCAGVNDEIIRDFVSRMDADYFETFRPEEHARHVGLVARLDPDHPCRVAIEAAPEGQFDVVVVANDYFSEFAIICGLLSAFELDIREGHIYTFSEAAEGPPARRPAAGPFRGRQAGRAGLARKKIVDLFRVRPMPGTAFTDDRQRRFIDELDVMIRLLDRNRLREARNRVNRKLAETLGGSRGTFSGLLQPVQIRFDNTLSLRDTVMDIRSTDTPAFLYAFANALAMRGIYIRKARFENVGAELHDRLYVRGRHGQKIEDPAEQRELRLTAALIKEFTHSLASAPDPAKALDHFDRFLDRILEEARDGKALAFFTHKKTLTLLARLLGASDYLWEDFLRRQHANLLPVLEDYQRLPLVRARSELTRELRQRLARARSDDQRRRLLNQYKDQEMFRIDMRHLLDPSTSLPDFSLALTELAETVLDQTVRECRAKLGRRHGVPKRADGTPCPFSVFGMGKFGGRELGYASDIEVLFVFGAEGRTSGRVSLDNSEYFERLAQDILQWIEAKQQGIFHLDVRLRPHGSKGVLTNTLDVLRTYYSPSGLSAPFERQALIKLRFVSGDAALGRQVEALRDGFVYSGQPWDLAVALDLRRRQIKELVEPGTTNVKYSHGGLIDVEYAVQYLQLLHGHTHAELRTPNTLAALAALGQVGLLPPRDMTTLREAYLFFRTLIDGLRMVRGNAQDLVLPPSEADEFVFLARRIGYTTEDWLEGARKLYADVGRHMTQVRAFFSGRFGTL